MEDLKLDVFSKERFKKLPRKTRKSIEALRKYDIPSGVRERLTKEYPFSRMSSDEIDACLIEFKKFVAVLLILREQKQRVAMVSEIIDEVWHTFVLFTIEYAEFSRKVAGEYIHHIPNRSPQTAGHDAARNFYIIYSKYFGQLHPVWSLRIVRFYSESPLEESASIAEDMRPSSMPVLTTPVASSTKIFDKPYERQDKLIHTTVKYHLIRTKLETGVLSTPIVPPYAGTVNCGSDWVSGSDGDGGCGGCGGCGG